MKSLKYFFILLSFLSLYYCAEADAKESKAKSNVFDKVDKRDKKLFTQQERIKSYNSSNDKSQSLKKSLSETSNYSGYGSSASKNKKDKKEVQKANKKKEKSKAKVNLEFSAYSTN